MLLCQLPRVIKLRVIVVSSVCDSVCVYVYVCVEWQETAASSKWKVIIPMIEGRLELCNELCG